MALIFHSNFILSIKSNRVIYNQYPTYTQWPFINIYPIEQFVFVIIPTHWIPFHEVLLGHVTQKLFTIKYPLMQTHIWPFQIWFDILHFWEPYEQVAPSKNVLTGQLWQIPLIKLKPSTHTHWIPFHIWLIEHWVMLGLQQFYVVLQKNPF